MSAGSTTVASLDIRESAADIPTDPSVTRLRRKNGTLESAVAGGAWGSLGGGGFGSDVLVSLPNAAAVDKTVSEWISAYSNSAAGAEQSTVTIKVLYGGVQEIAFKIDGLDTIDVPGSLRWVFDNDTGLRRSAANTTAMVCQGVDVAFFTTGGISLISSSKIFWAGVAAELSYASVTGSVALKPGVGNVELGSLAGALATTATAGFVTIPTCAGAATGAATITAGQAAMIYDSTNNKIYVRSGGTWRSTAALT